MRHPLRIAALTAGLLSLSGCRPHPTTPLTRAAAEGRIDQIEALLAQGAAVDGEDGGFTPLIWAARQGQVEAVSLLVARGASLERQAGVNDWTPLIHAIHKGQSGAALAILEAGAKVSGRSGGEALHMAAGYGNEKMVRALLERGADPRWTTSGGDTILSNAVSGAFDIDYEWSGCGPHTAVVRALLEKAPGLTLPDNNAGRSALRSALRRNCSEMLDLLEGRSSPDRAGGS